MVQKSATFWKDWAERVAWTALQAALGLVTVEMFDLPLWAAPPLATGLAAAKGFVAQHVGNPDSASLTSSI